MPHSDTSKSVLPCKDKRSRSPCPVTFALDMFGDKWSLLIVRDLLFRGRKTYGEFLAAGDGISTNILADRLKNLETKGIIVKSTDSENRRKNIYKLTQKGLDLMPILLEMIRWSGSYDPQTGAPKEFLERLDNDKDSLVADLLNELKIWRDLGEF